jgi:hypothetical protein
MKRRAFVTGAVLGGPLAIAAAGETEHRLRVATFQADVTPPLGAVLCHGSITPAKEIVSPLTARGVILLTGSKPIVLCSVDWVGIGNGAHDAWQAALARAARMSVDRVSLHVVHQHG